MSEVARCELCGEPMSSGEEMFKYHGYSGPCPKPPLPKATPRYAVERVSDEEWRVVRDGAYVMARCKFVQDADAIANALRRRHPMTPPTGQKTLRDEPWFQNLTVGCRHLVQQLANRAARPHLLAAIDEAERRLLAVDHAPQETGASTAKTAGDDRSHDPMINRLLAIAAQIIGLCDDIQMREVEWSQPDFQIGILNGALAAITSEIPDDDPRLGDLYQHSAERRLLRAINDMPIPVRPEKGQDDA
jgi:hypothetical protein